MSGKNLGTQIQIRALDDAQRGRWRAAAERERRNLSDWIRVTLDDAAERITKSKTDRGSPKRIRGAT